MVRATQAVAYKITRRMRFAYRLSQATDDRSEYVILIAFHSKNGYVNMPQYYVIHTPHVLFQLKYPSGL